MKGKKYTVIILLAVVLTACTFGDTVRTPTPPLNMREWREVDSDFLDNFTGRQELTFVEHGDLSFGERWPWWGWDTQLEDHTMIFWTDEELRDFRVVALGFNDIDDSFYVRHELDDMFSFHPNSLYMLNVELLHSLMPRVGITFTDSHGNHHRLLIQKDIQGEPLFSLSVFDENHFATWGETIAPKPFAMRDGGRFNIRGIGGHHAFYDPRDSRFYFVGRGFDVIGLHDEAIEGGAQITHDSIRVTFDVGRNEIILPYIDGPMGELTGPTVSFEYTKGVGIVSEIECNPFEFYNDRHPPIYFEMPEEGAIQMAQLLLLAKELVDNHLSIFPYHLL